MNKKYVQINIGQGGLTGGRWSEFIANTVVALLQSMRGWFNDQPGIEQHDGSGWWDGALEDSVHISTVADVDIFALRVKLAELKKHYSQDSIALIVGSDLI